MISHEHKIIFIHIPKTGGTSIERFFGVNPVEFCKEKLSGLHTKHGWLQHCTLTEMETCFDIDINNFYSFTFVRNPWDKMVSSYFYELKWIKDKKLNFLGYVKNSPEINKYHNKAHRREQYQYIIDQSNEPAVNYIGRFENLQQDFDIVCDKIGIPRQKLPHVNKTKHKHYTEYYDDETREIVAEKYKKDIEQYGYTFEK